MSDLSQLSMMDLFRMEAEQHVAALASGLLALEAQPGDAPLLAGLMRAAHSMKGAARIVGLQGVVELTHAMESLLTRGQHGTQVLTRSHIDALLAASDHIADLSALDDHALQAALAAQQADIAALVAALDNPAPPAASAAASAANGVADSTLHPPLASPTAAAGPRSTQLEAAPEPANAGALAVPSPPAPSATTTVAAAGAAAAAPERQLRLGASQLESLLGLAREAVLLNRRHGQQEPTLLRLRRQQQQVARRLDQLHDGLAQRASDDALQAPLQQARELLAQTQTLLDVHLEDQRQQTQRGHQVANRLHHTVNSVRMVPFASQVAGLQRMCRDVAHLLGKSVRLQLQGERCLIDRDVLERIEAPLSHLLRNAIDHAIETPAERVALGKPERATLTLAARHARGLLEVSVSDDGRGIALDALRAAIIERGLAAAALVPQLSDTELLDFLFLPGFSTRHEVTEISGRGVGLDVVQTTVHALGGRLRVDNRPGAGLTITLVLPLSLSLVRALLVQVGGAILAFPLARVERIVRLPASTLESIGHASHAWIDGAAVSVVSLARLLDAEAGATPAELPLVLLADAQGRRYAVAVDGLLGQTELALQALDRRLGKLKDVAAAAVLDDGSPVLMLDVDDLATSLAALSAQGGAAAPTAATGDGGTLAGPRRVLVVEDSFAVREVERKMLAGAGYHVTVAVDGVDGWTTLRNADFDLVLTDIDMPRMNGIELLQHIRASPRHQALPVMVVSYKERDEDRQRGLAAGASHYFTKSNFDEAALLQAVADLIGTA